MQAEETLVAWLAGFGALTALVADRIYPDVIPRDKALPAIAYARTNTDPALTIHGTKLAEFADVQVQSWGKTRTEADAVGDQVEQALQANGEVALNRRVAFDEESGNFGDVIDVRLLINF